MKIEQFEMERMQSTWENRVEMDLSESGVRPVTMRELAGMGLDMDWVLDTPLGYSQSNGTLPLREELAKQYPGTTPDHIEVTNGTSEANYLLALALVRDGDEVAFEVPNYMQYWGLPRSLGAKVNCFQLQPVTAGPDAEKWGQPVEGAGGHGAGAAAISGEEGWEPDWEEFERGVNKRTRLVYVSNPNNPSGSVLSERAMRRIVERVEKVGAYLIADEVYLGAEIHGERARSFWGMSERVIVTSGLSKAYGIPGVRIGWIVGPKEVVAECWGQHDYLTIGPNKISDAIARVAVRPENREKLYARTREILQQNLPIVKDWVESFEGFLSFREPRAGALCLIRYNAAIPSVDLCERIRVNQNVLVVPGKQLGVEGFIRVWIGGKPEFLREGLRRIGVELRKEPACARAGE